MKKVIILLFFIMLVNGCKSNTFSLDSEYYNSNEFILINDTLFNNLIDNNKSFIVFVYDDSCITCKNFNEVLQEFIDKENVSIYKLSYKDMKNTILKKDIKYYPSLAIFNNGKLVNYLDAFDDNDTKYYKSYENVKIWILKYINI